MRLPPEARLAPLPAELRELPSKCGHPSGIYVNIATGVVIAAPCGSWECAHCAKTKAWKIAERVSKVQYEPTYMLTFTARESYRLYTWSEQGITDGTRYDTERGDEAGVASYGLPDMYARNVTAFNQKVNKWFKRLRRQQNRDYGAKNVRQMWGNERGPDTGHLHKHALVDGCPYIDYSKNSGYTHDWDAELGMGATEVTPIKRQADYKRLVRYVLKYVSKHSAPLPKGSHKVHCFAPAEKLKEKSEWMFIARARTRVRQRHEEEVLPVRDDGVFPIGQIPLPLDLVMKEEVAAYRLARVGAGQGAPP